MTTNKDGFGDQLRELAARFDLQPEEDKRTADLAYAFSNRVEIYHRALKVIDGWSQRYRDALFFDYIDKFLLKHNLGKEWDLAITTYLITGFICPPIFNLQIEEAEDEFKKKRVVLLLNPDTTIEDIKNQWDVISKRQKELWPDFKKASLRKTSFRNLLKYAQAEAKRYNLTDEERWPGFDDYERMMIKRGRYKEVVKLRREGKIKVKPLKTKNKKTNAELAREITQIRDKKGLKREANKLSQLKRRIAQSI
ncbi:MAG: hypothetical protein HYT63_03070 [Candidatus Yanofskybacteria bacterium]|nr:hypothetical protein [Candidatus Yanofskybacteria bacterium]